MTPCIHGDTVTDNLGNEYDVQISFGSILKVTPINSKDIDELPILTVNSSTGSGAVLKANLEHMHVLKHFGHFSRGFSF